MFRASISVFDIFFLSQFLGKYLCRILPLCSIAFCKHLSNDQHHSFAKVFLKIWKNLLKFLLIIDPLGSMNFRIKFFSKLRTLVRKKRINCILVVHWTSINYKSWKRKSMRSSGKWKKWVSIVFFYWVFIAWFN